MPLLRVSAFTVITVVVMILASAGAPMFLAAQEPLASSKSSRKGPAPIRLQVGTFYPASDEQLPIPPELTTAAYADHERVYYIVQFDGPVQEDWKSPVTAVGAEILDYIPEYAFKARMSPAQAGRVEELDHVAAVVLFQPAFKLSPDLAREGRNLYAVQIERGVDVAEATEEIASLGGEVLTVEGQVLTVAAEAKHLALIANVRDVAWIENVPYFESLNEYGGRAIMGAGAANASGYDGSSQIVAVADSGLGGGTSAGAHPDIPSNRIVAIYNWPGTDNGCFSNVIDDGPIDVDTGHGTHVVGSVLSDGGPQGEGRGTAPAARLVFQATENFAEWNGECGGRADSHPRYHNTGIPSDLYPIYQQAYNAGARIHSNSWGANVQGAYTLGSSTTDEFIWNNPDMTITFAAGNAGVDANADGIVDAGSLNAPASAKNVISVGASENDRRGHYECDLSLNYVSHDQGLTCSDMGGSNRLPTWAAVVRNDGAPAFPAEPLWSDPNAGNAEQMAAFSSRGLTRDNRLKPDVVAPGTWILSTYSPLYQEGYSTSVNPLTGIYQDDGYGMPLSRSYKYSGGTSMATPLVAGAAAVVRDYYHKAFRGHAASAALVKATLINSAVDLRDENNDGVNDNAYPIPNIHEGWGRVDVAAATDGTARVVDERNGIGTDQTAPYEVSIGSNGKPLKISLVWSDAPSSDAASKNLVNDLDLVVVAPDGTRYSGNIFRRGWSHPGEPWDDINNVENVYVQSAMAGKWTIDVHGFNVPIGPQPFALVVDGTFGEPVETPPPPPPANPTPTPSPVPTPTPTSEPIVHAPSDIDYGPYVRTWARTDMPVMDQGVSRTWMWGPEPFAPPLLEPYVESPNQERVVLYFDKSRMEVTHPDAVDDGLWYVTNGLLVKELMTGQMQVGDTDERRRAPAEVNVAGDPGSGPTYAALNPLRSSSARPEGTVIIERLHADGSVTADGALAGFGVTAGHYVGDTNHTVAQPFWVFMNSSGLVYDDDRFVSDQLFINPFYATGFPITEAYWATVSVAGTPKDVLLQCFERRCLTYTPDNPPGWQVEAGNVGQHYFRWRYGSLP